MPFASREAQTRIKHEILRDYAGAWAGIISQGTAKRSPRGTVLDLAYFDGFAGCGRYECDEDRPHSQERIWGSPILALEALKATAAKAPDNIQVRVTGILAEENTGRYDELVENLGASGLDLRVNEVQRLHQVELGAITVVRGDVRPRVEELLAGLGASVFLLAFTDPYGTAMPMNLLRQIVARQQTDTVTLFPVYDVHKYAGSALKPPSAREDGDRDNIRRNTIHLGTEEWLEIAARDLPVEEAAPLYVELYRRQLRAAAPKTVAKDIGLSFSSRSQAFGLPGYHIFLTTRNPHGAFRMNSILRQAGYRRYWTHWGDHEAREAGERDARGELELGLEVPFMPVPTVQRVEVSTEEVEGALVEALVPGDYTLKQILGLLADSIFKEGEVKKGLRGLKKQGRAGFQNLDGDLSRVEVLARP